MSVSLVPSRTSGDEPPPASACQRQQVQSQEVIAAIGRHSKGDLGALLVGWLAYIFSAAFGVGKREKWVKDRHLDGASV